MRSSPSLQPVTTALNLPGDGNDRACPGPSAAGAPRLNSWAACVVLSLAACAQGATTYHSTDVPKTIADLATVTSTLTVPGSGAMIADVNVQLRITHSYDGDLDVYLVGPNGTTVELFTDVGGSGDNFTDTILDDQAATSIAAGIAPFAGSYRPEGLLSAFNGLAANGVWTLRITDDAGADTGALASWSITIETATACAPPSVPTHLTPLNGATGVSTASTVTWLPNADACPPTYDVYLDTINPPAAKVCSALAATSCDPPGELSPGTVYYWRVVAVNSGGSAPGAVWSFTTGGCTAPAAPAAPSPAHGATAVTLNADLGWNAGGEGLLADGSAEEPMPAIDPNLQWWQAQPAGDWCGTEERYLARMLALGSSRDAALCGTLGTCDTVAERDAHIPTGATPIKTYRMSIHVFCDDAGANCTASQASVDAQMVTLNTNYLPWRIQFVYETEFINSTLYRSWDPQEEAAMKAAYAKAPTQKLNVYVVVNSGSYSVATFPWDPDCLTYMGGIVMHQPMFGGGVATLAHEVGHCLGLWHTHHGVSEVSGCIDCRELAGTPSDTTGDYCSQTVPTPVNYNCADPGGTDACNGVAWGVTDFRNYMGYAPSSCRTEFESQQAGRFHCWPEQVLTGWLTTTTPPCPVAYDVYFGTTNPPTTPICTNVTSPLVCDPGTLAYSTTYYWKVVSKTAGGNTSSPVWSFSTVSCPAPPVPAAPVPAHAATGVSVDAALSWGAAGLSDLVLEASPDQAVFDPEEASAPGVVMEGQFLTDDLATGCFSFGNQSATFSGFPRLRGNVYAVSSTQYLNEIKALLTFSGSADLIYYVFEATAPTGTYTKIFEKSVPTTGTGGTLYSSGPLSVEMVVGKYYAICLGWTTPSISYYRNTTSAYPVSWSLGTINGIVLVDSSPPFATIPSGGVYTNLPTYAFELCFGAAPCPVTYDVYMGTTNPPPTKVGSDLTSPTFDPPGSLLAGVTYYWQVVAKSCCTQRVGSVWSFTTAGAPAVTGWRSVRSHSGLGALGIALNPTATGNGLSGPTVETRQGGILRIEVDFNSPVTLSANPVAGVSVVGRTTSSGVPGAAINYTPAAVQLSAPGTVALLFNAGQLPDQTCYTITLGSGLITGALTGDTNVNVRSLTGDVIMNGEVNVGDLQSLKSKLNAAVGSNVPYDVNMTGGLINIGDALAAKQYVVSPTRKALCP